MLAVEDVEPLAAGDGSLTSINTVSAVPYAIVGTSPRRGALCRRSHRSDESWTLRRRYGAAHHGAPPRGRQLSARIIFFRNCQLSAISGQPDASDKETIARESITSRKTFEQEPTEETEQN